MFVITQGYLSGLVITSGYGSAVVPPTPTQENRVGGWPLTNLVDLVLGKNLKRGKPHKHKSELVYHLSVESRVKVVKIKPTPPLRKQRKVQRLPVEVLMLIDDDLATIALATQV